MPIGADLALFVAASMVLICTPGQDMILVMSRSLAQGPRAGVATAAGVSVGLLGHTVLAALGLGALLTASEWAFLVLKIVGAAYLVWLGIGLLRTRAATVLAADPAPAATGRQLFVAGALSNLSNPKIAIFYFAFLPQFVAPDATSPTATLLLLGALFAALTFVVKGPVGWFAGTLSGWLRSRPAVLVAIHRVSGGVLVALGVRLALSQKD